LAEGSLRASDNDLRLTVGNPPAGAFVQLSSSPVFGRGGRSFVQGVRRSGALCLGGEVMRHAWTNAGAGAIQCFYRDPSCAGESNFSDAIRIRFE